MAEAEVTAFLTHLAREGNIAASTQNQALSALLFLYKEVLQTEIGWFERVERATKPKRLPVVLNGSEVYKIFAHLRKSGHGLETIKAGKRERRGSLNVVARSCARRTRHAGPAIQARVPQDADR